MPRNIRIQWNAGTGCVSECVLKTLACRGLRVGPSSKSTSNSKEGHWGRSKTGPIALSFVNYCVACRDPLYSDPNTPPITNWAGTSCRHGLVTCGMVIFQSPSEIFQRSKFAGKSLKFSRKSNFKAPNFEIQSPKKMQFRTPAIPDPI